MPPHRNVIVQIPVHGKRTRGTVHESYSGREIQNTCKAMEDRIVAERNEEKVNNTVEIMKNLMETMKWTVDQTLKAMNIPESDYGIYKNRV